VQAQDLFEKLSPSEAVLSFLPCPNMFDYNALVVFKKGKLILVNLLKSAEKQSLVTVTKKVTFQKVGSQSIADSQTENSDAGERYFLVPLSESEFALVFEEAVKLYQISNFDLVLMKEYDEIINDTISNFCYYREHGSKSLTHLAIGTETSSQVCLINLKSSAVDKTLNFDDGTITSVFEIGNKYIAATSINGNLVVWDKMTFIQIMREELMAAILIVYKIPGTDLIAIGGQGPVFIYQDLDKIAEVKLKQNEESIVDFAYNDSKQLLIMGNESGTLFTYSISELLN
jgi:hypothetical protein